MNLNELYTEALTGNKQAEQRLFKYLSDSFYLFVQKRIWNRNETEEIVQDAMLVIADKYKTVELKSSFAGWAYKIVTHKILDYIKLNKIHSRRMQEYVTGKTAAGDHVKIDPETRIQLKRCLKKIIAANRRFARILSLHYQGFGTEDICRRLNISPSNFYTLLSRARSMLMQCLEDGVNGNE